MYRNGYGVLGTFNPQVEKTLKDIKEEMDKEKKSGDPDKERLMLLAQEAMVQGLKLNVGYIRNCGQLGIF